MARTLAKRAMSLWQQHPHNVPPPFQGAPPPPNGVNVPYWNQGTWMPNPHYNPHAGRPAATQWLPGNGWGIPQATGAYYPAYQQQQQQSFNPYKRQPKPPSAEYLALKLSDNPLGLTNMVPAEEVERQERERQEEQQAQVTQTTPWLWAPRQLDEDEDDPDQPAKEPASPPDTPEPFASKATLQPTFSSNIIRTPQHYRSSAPVQIYASPKRPLDRGASVDNLASEIGRLSTTSAPLIRHHSMPTTLSHHPNSNPSITGETLTREPDPMELLSPLAGVLPPPKSRSNLGRHSSVPAASTTSLDPIPESSATKSVSHSRPRTPAPPPTHRSNRHDGSRSSSTSPYSEQSPTVYSSSSGSGHSPYHPHSSPTYQDPHVRNPLPAPPKPHETYEPSNHHHHHHYTSPGTSSSSFTYMPPSSAPPPPPPASPSHSRSRSRSSSTTKAIPTFTEEPGTAVLHANGKSTVIHLSSTSSPHEISSFTSPTEKRIKKSSKRQRRKGFWNRRGDHVTAHGYIVYAPPDQVYPAELDDYPDGKDAGYMNEDGHLTSWHKRPTFNPPGGYLSVELFLFWLE
ncbi:hypothetical protein AGABI1DRAFT_131874 [Agaricus bisporus var. burnettii JB137-S8]|uniref:Uncharacterized protein n=1 Tax=Agaricus bisporus var. burnettii (strain JB137-S8 / ATCC MYA-4627 / FGSC 10392) TaxID=597362 RepID=K5WKH6_AGABU|nr:uncharacterized protein AGABI1DRAFT_131874 [Agaricus bisporus var. burnettii JB137-S8]EKM75796.1 hypothetical protein AGABI1DRAFT_131874 [Agaricus bisporus var. burnettii JB137-S8]